MRQAKLFRALALVVLSALQASPASAQFNGASAFGRITGGGGGTPPSQVLACGDAELTVTTSLVTGTPLNYPACPSNTLAVGNLIKLTLSLVDGSNIGSHNPQCPAGFTKPPIASVSNPLQNIPGFVKVTEALVCWKKAVTADTAGGGGTLAYTFNWTTPVTDQATWGLSAYSGQDPTTPIDAIANNGNDDGSGVYTVTQNAPSVTPTFAHDLLVCDYFLARGDPGATTDPAGMTLQLNMDGLSTNPSFKSFTQVLTTTSPTGTKVLTVPADGAGGSSGVGDCMAIKGT